MRTMLVTALFDINRHLYDGRTIDDYLSWIDVTLKIKNDMTIYTEEKFFNFIKNSRKESKFITNIVIQELEQLPFYRYNQKIKNIINLNFFRSNIKASSRIECNLSEYNIIQYSKFDWLLKTTNENKSDFYFWLDAGISRFFHNFDIKSEWPNENKFLKDKIIIQNTYLFNEYMKNFDFKNYMWDCNALVCGTLIGGNKQNLITLHEKVEKYWELMLSSNCVNNEQILLAGIINDHPELFDIREKHGGDYSPYLPLFEDLSCRE